jgi:hypothetical protein
MALAVLLAAGAGLLIRSVANLRAIDPGVKTSGVVIVDATMPLRLTPAERRRVGARREDVQLCGKSDDKCKLDQPCQPRPSLFAHLFSHSLPLPEVLRLNLWVIGYGDPNGISNARPIVSLPSKGSVRESRIENVELHEYEYLPVLQSTETEQLPLRKNVLLPTA